MARARNIKHGFFTNDELAEVPALGRLLFIGLWTIADREGRLEDRPKKIKAEVLPYDDCDVSQLLNELDGRGFITRYKVDGNSFIQINNFSKHQNPHVKEAESTIPAPCESGASTEQSEKSTERATLIPDSGFLIPDSVPKPETGFDAFWKTWPRGERKQGKSDCLKVWKKAKLEPIAGTIIAHVERMKESKSWREGYDPLPATYLRQQRWDGAEDAYANQAAGTDL